MKASAHLKLLAAVLLITAALAAGPGRLCSPARAQDVSKGRVHARSAVIFLHMGGYIGGSAAFPWTAATYFARHGWRVIKADYPLNDIAGARNYVRRLALRLQRSYRRVTAYGESAGGGLAALAAARGWVDAAVCNSGVVSPLTGGWPHDTTQAQRALNSPGTYAGDATNRPLWLIVGSADTIVDPAPAIALRRAYPDSRLTVIAGGQHVISFTDYAAAARYMKTAR
jgi:dienelactone hydrolase